MTLFANVLRHKSVKSYSPVKARFEVTHVSNHDVWIKTAMPGRGSLSVEVDVHYLTVDTRYLAMH